MLVTEAEEFDKNRRFSLLGRGNDVPTRATRAKLHSE